MKNKHKEFSVNAIYEASKWAPWALYLSEGHKSMLRIQDHINDLKKELSAIVGPEETEKVYNDLKNEAYQQGSPNGQYILNRLFDMVQQYKNKAVR